MQGSAACVCHIFIDQDTVAECLTVELTLSLLNKSRIFYRLPEKNTFMAQIFSNNISA